MTETDQPASGGGLPDDAEEFDPAKHLSPGGDPASDEPVYLEMACSCGGILKQYDRADLLKASVESWEDRHGGPGHGPASIADAVSERESRREAAYRAAGRSGEFEPSSVEGASTDVKAWPDMSAAGSGAREGNSA